MGGADVPQEEKIERELETGGVLLVTKTKNQ
jgi:hypothetical protein